MNDVWSELAVGVFVFMSLMAILIFIWLRTLYRRMMIIRYCYLDLSDWASIHLASLEEQVRLLVEETVNKNYTTDQIEHCIPDDVLNWKELLANKVEHHFDIMRRNNAETPSNEDMQLSLTEWYK